MPLFEIDTEVVIDAPVQQVWAALVDFERYQDWNPFIPHAAGTPDVGTVLNIRIRPVGKKSQKYKVQILEAVHQSKLTWLGHLVLPGLCDGHHVLELLPLEGNKTKLLHRETFRGLLVPFVRHSFLKLRILPGFRAMNTSLKAYVEGQATL